MKTESTYERVYRETYDILSAACKRDGVMPDSRIARAAEHAAKQAKERQEYLDLCEQIGRGPNAVVCH